MVIRTISDCFYGGACGRRDPGVAAILLFTFRSSGVTAMRLDRRRLKAKQHDIGEGGYLRLSPWTQVEVMYFYGL